MLAHDWWGALFGTSASRVATPSALAQVFIEDCLPNFEAPVSNFVRAVNALNDGKGLGVNAGSPAPKCAVVSPDGPVDMSACKHWSTRYFYRLRWSAASYKRGQLRPVGLDTAEALFPQVADAVAESGRKRRRDSALAPVRNVRPVGDEMPVWLQLDYIQGMGARCAGSDPDIVAMAQVAKRLKRVYFTGRCVRHIWRILLDGRAAFVWDVAVPVCWS